MAMDGNVFLNGATPSKDEKAPLVLRDFNPNVRVVEESGGFYLEMKCDPAWSTGRARQLVTSKLLGTAAISKAPFETRDRQPISINTDYFGHSRSESNPAPGPFENPGQGEVKLKVW